MVADWQREHFADLVSIDKREAFEEFISENAVNDHQRILLIAESYDYVTLRTAQWLTDFHGVNIVCYKVALAKDSITGSEYLSAVRLFPPVQLADQALSRGTSRSQQPGKFATIEELLESCDNEEVRVYFRSLPPDSRRNRRRNSIVFPPIGKMRFRVRPKTGYARVQQLGRFEGDEILWQQNLSAPIVLPRVNDLGFRLHTSGDVRFFQHLCRSSLHCKAGLKPIRSTRTTTARKTKDPCSRMITRSVILLLRGIRDAAARRFR